MSSRKATVDGGLTRERVVREAIRIAGQSGVDGLSMRGLATALGAGAMSLYHYVANKEALLDAMIDAIFQDIAVPTPGDAWQSAMRHHMHSTRAVLLQHTWALRLMESRTAPGTANRHHHEAVMRCLREAGFSPIMATQANWLLDSYVFGFVLQESGMAFNSNADGAPAADMASMVENVYLEQLPPEQFPYLHEAATALVRANADVAEQFTFGLDLILNALEPLRTDQ